MPTRYFVYSKEYNSFLGVCSVLAKNLTNFDSPKQNLNSLRAARITDKHYTPQMERFCILWGNPVILHIYRLRGNTKVIIGFSLQSVNSITGFPHNIHNLSLLELKGFFVILTAFFHR